MQSLQDIHPYDWAPVKRKAFVKKIVSAITKAGRTIENIHISRAYGSVYIEIGDGEYCQEYNCWDDMITVRVADHARTSSEHAYPHYNVYDASSLAEALRQITANL